MRRRLAYLVLLALCWRSQWRPASSVDYTRRCLGCGYYDGEPEAGVEHYGWSCRFVDCPWWEPLAEWWWGSGVIGSVRARYLRWRWPEGSDPF